MNKDDDVVYMNNEWCFNPYNSKNKWISLNQVQTILNTYGVTTPLINFELYKQCHHLCSSYIYL